MSEDSPREDMYRKLRAFEALAREQDDQLERLETEKDGLIHEIVAAANVIVRSSDGLQILKEQGELIAGEDTVLYELLRDWGVVDEQT